MHKHSTLHHFAAGFVVASMAYTLAFILYPVL
jgi:hypothetical protein